MTRPRPAEAVQELSEALTNEVIDTANSKDAVMQRTDLKKTLSSLRLAVAKTSAPGKDELLRKLSRVR